MKTLSRRQRASILLEVTLFIQNIYPFLIGKNYTHSRIIHHNQLLFTNFRILPYWTDDVKSEVRCRLSHRSFSPSTVHRGLPPRWITTSMVSYCSQMWSTCLIFFLPALCLGTTNQSISCETWNKRNKTYFGMSCAGLHPITIAILQRGSPTPKEKQSPVFSRTGNSIMF